MIFRRYARRTAEAVQAMVHCSSVPTPLARRTRLVSAPAVVYDTTQPKYDTAGALASALLQRYMASLATTVWICIYVDY